MDRWWESFAQWDHRSQLTFSSVVVILSFVLVVLAGLWLMALLRAVTEALGVLFGRHRVREDFGGLPLTEEQERSVVRLARELSRAGQEESKPCPPRPPPRPTTPAATASTPPATA